MQSVLHDLPCVLSSVVLEGEVCPRRPCCDIRPGCQELSDEPAMAWAC